MWKSNKTLERQLESERKQVAQLKETLGTLTRQLENQIKENEDQFKLFNQYHNTVEKMITNEVVEWERTLTNLVNVLAGYSPYDVYGDDRGVKDLLLKVRNELEKTSQGSYFSKELLQVIANNYERK